MYQRVYTIKEIAQELKITREYLHKRLKPFKNMFKAAGNMKTSTRKTKYTEAERDLILKFYEISKHTSNL
jgi:hypothetical protein